MGGNADSRFGAEAQGSMVAQKWMALFCKEYTGDPRLLLLDRALNSLLPEEQIHLIVSVLADKEVWGWKFPSEKGEIVAVVDALEKLMGEGVVFRKKLMVICNAIPMQVPNGTQEGRLHNEQVEVGSDLRLVMLGKIMYGWAREKEDAEACFIFLCRSYVLAPQATNSYELKEEGRVRKGILELFRKLDRRDFLYTNQGKGDRWIIHPQTPKDVAEILLHAQLRSRDGVRLAVERIKRSQP